MPKKADAEKAKYREYLLEAVRPGDTVWCVVRNVSASGMSRTISMFVIRCEPEMNAYTGGVGVYQIHYNTANVLGWRYSQRHEGVCVQGCGMDMGFHLVDCLSRALGFTGSQTLKHRWL